MPLATCNKKLYQLNRAHRSLARLPDESMRERCEREKITAQHKEQCPLGPNAVSGIALLIAD